MKTNHAVIRLQTELELLEKIALKNSNELNRVRFSIEALEANESVYSAAIKDVKEAIALLSK